MRPFSQYESFRQHDWGSQFWANFVAAAKNVNRLAELIAKTIPSAADREREDLRRARRPTETLHGANAPAPCPGLILRMIHGHMSGKTLVRGGGGHSWGRESCQQASASGAKPPGNRPLLPVCVSTGAVGSGPRTLVRFAAASCAAFYQREHFEIRARQPLTRSSAVSCA